MHSAFQNNFTGTSLCDPIFQDLRHFFDNRFTAFPEIPTRGCIWSPFLGSESWSHPSYTYTMYMYVYVRCMMYDVYITYIHVSYVWQNPAILGRAWWSSSVSIWSYSQTNHGTVLCHGNPMTTIISSSRKSWMACQKSVDSLEILDGIVALK